MPGCLAHIEQREKVCEPDQSLGNEGILDGLSRGRGIACRIVGYLRMDHAGRPAAFVGGIGKNRRGFVYRSRRREHETVEMATSHSTTGESLLDR